MVGLEKADDAAVYRLNEKQAIITTTDFFPPVVDDPYDFGSIAAANAMSDIYAMGGEVLFALNLIAFPDNLGAEILREILREFSTNISIPHYFFAYKSPSSEVSDQRGGS